MKKNILENLVGALVLAVAIYFCYYAIQKSEIQSFDSYEIFADFSNVSGLRSGSEVRTGGVKIGEVRSMHLDPISYNAIVAMKIKREIKLPDDSIASIVSDGILGEKHLAIEIGGSDEFVQEGGEIEFTQSSVSIETLISKAIFSKGE